MKRVNFDTGTGTQKTIQVSPRVSAKINVRVNENRRNRLVRMGLAPFKVKKNNTDQNIPGPREYPSDLIRVFRESQVTLDFIPPNRELKIIARSHQGSPFGNNDERNITTRSIDPLQPGEQKSVFLNIE
jgi:hypothetical protein